MKYYVHAESVANNPSQWVECDSKEEADLMAFDKSVSHIVTWVSVAHMVSVVASDGVVVDQYIPWLLAD